MKLSDYLVSKKEKGAYPFVPWIECVDGFKMSVQCHSGSYCTPRTDHSRYYTHVEVGFPSDIPTTFLSYAEDSDNPTNTVYGWVPIELVAEEINLHGGIVGVGTLEI
jgi:hypothetical protein